MFFLLCLFSAFSFALQSTLMVPYYRKLDPLSAISYRSLSLGITMLPLLYFVPTEDYPKLYSYAPLVALAGFCTAIGYWALAKAYRLLPFGIAVALHVGMGTLIVTTVGSLALAQVLSIRELCQITGLTLAVLLLGISRSAGKLPQEYNPMAGFLCALVSSILIAAALSCLTVVSRSVHPFLAAYSWELAAGLSAIGYAVIREVVRGEVVSRVSLKEAGDILQRTSPAVIGNGCYIFAISIGPIAMAAAIKSTNIVIGAVLAYYFFREMPTRWQWMLISLITFSLVALKLSE